MNIIEKETQITINDFEEPYGYIYIILNKVNGKRYIGQTTDKKGYRVNLTKGQLKFNYNDHFNNSFVKYGKNNFSIKIVSSAKSKEALDRREEYYIHKFNTLDREFGYNLRHGGAKGRHSEETKRRMSRARKGKCCGKDNPMYNKNHTEEAKRKIAKGRSEKYRGSGNPNFKYRISKEYLTQNYIEENKTIEQIADCVGCSQNTIARRLRSYKIPIKDKKQYCKILNLQNNKDLLEEQYWTLKKSITEIAKDYNCCYNTIHRAMKKLKIPRRERGWTLSEEAKNKISRGNKGKKRSEENKKKISETLKKIYRNPKNHPMYNKHHTEEAKKKISDARKKRKREGIDK